MKEIWSVCWHATSDYLVKKSNANDDNVCLQNKRFFCIGRKSLSAFMVTSHRPFHANEGGAKG